MSTSDTGPGSGLGLVRLSPPIHLLRLRPLVLALSQCDQLNVLSVYSARPHSNERPITVYDHTSYQSVRRSNPVYRRP